MILICETCLKFPICKWKQGVECKDLVLWLLQNDTTTVEFNERITHIETLWGREISIISLEVIEFKKEMDQYSCLIVKDAL